MNTIYDGYDYNHYNAPEIGNKHVYAYGSGNYTPLSWCGFIYADNKTQAKKVLRAHDRAWHDNNMLLNYTEEHIYAEIERRKAAIA